MSIPVLPSSQSHPALSQQHSASESSPLLATTSATSYSLSASPDNETRDLFEDRHASSHEQETHTCQCSNCPPRSTDQGTISGHRLSSPLASFFAACDTSMSLTLVNTGSVARDHLAGERTFLAYVRTSLAIASAGVALVQLLALSRATSGPAAHYLLEYAEVLGAACILMGMVVLAIGFVRYFTVQSALIKGDFPVARFVIGGMALAIIVLIVLTFGILIAIRYLS